jgi:hypothetical protein
MIPGKILRFLEEGANVAIAGTRDENLVPHGHRVSGWRVGADLTTMTVLVPEQFTEHLVTSLQDNGRFAVTIEEFPSHETYQFKGRYLRHRPIDSEDRAVDSRIRERFAKGVHKVFADWSVDMLRGFVPEPALAVEFEVHEIFLQTPGPGAGTRIAPPLPEVVTWT